MIHFPNAHLDLDYLNAGETVAEACARAGMPLDLVCGGTGRCGQCRILIRKNGTAMEVLACQYHVCDEMEILTDREKNQKILDQHIDFDPLILDPPVLCFPVSRESLNLRTPKSFLGSINAVLPVELACGDPDLLIAGFEAVRKNPVPVVDVIASVKEGADGQEMRSGTLLGLDPETGAVPNFGAAFDVGTTTVVGYLYNLEDGSLCVTASARNRQRTYGADVISRIAAAGEGKLEGLHKAVCETLSDIIHALCQKSGTVTPRQIISVVCCGNTTMLHLLAGVSPKSLGTAPFVSQIKTSVTKPAREWHLDLHPAAQMTLLSPIDSYIGSDTGALLAALPQREWEMRLVIDLGTNAEIALGRENQYTVCSAPCGPALEGDGLTMGMRAEEGAIEKVRYDAGTKRFLCETIGGAPAKGLCGSGVIDTIAALRDSGLLKADGAFIRENDCPKHPNGNRLVRRGKIRQFILLTSEENHGAGEVVITQKDIRSIQLAKAAIATAIDMLLKETQMTLNNIDTVYLAGAFGNYISVPSAQKIGLLPTGQHLRVVPVGNGAGSGTIHCLLSLASKNRTEQMPKRCHVINLANDPEFNQVLLLNTALSSQ
ncbi:MAG: ASKHA domain-containing protein [Pseudoramibacter sp.]